jgi:hypothetical protein
MPGGDLMSGNSAGIAHSILALCDRRRYSECCIPLIGTSHVLLSKLPELIAI